MKFKPFFAFMLVAGVMCSCGHDVDPVDQDPEIPGTEGCTYELKTIEYDGQLAADAAADAVDKENTDIYWEGEAEEDGTFKNTITITYVGSDATVEMSKNAAKVYAFTKNGAHVALYPSGDDVKKCEIILSGASDNGSLKIYNTTDPTDKEAGKKTKLTLNGVSLKSAVGPAINYQSGKRMFLHLADGTTNTLEDGANYEDDIYYWAGRTSEDEDRKGCFFSEKAVIVSGTGLLKVKGNCKNAIGVDDDFYMRPGATVVVTDAAGTCLSCKDEIHLAGGYLYCSTSADGGRGVKTDSTLIVDAARLIVNTSGSYGNDKGEKTSPKGIRTDKDIIVNGGEVTVRCTGRCEGAEGIESKANITINGGKVDVLTYDDAINAEESLTVNDGDIRCISANNDGIDSNGSINVNGGKLFSVAANMEAALDNDNHGKDTKLIITGGEVVGIGGSVFAPSAGTTQCSIAYNGCPVSTSEEFAVKDQNGAKLFSFTSPQGSKSAGVLLSSPALVQGAAYTISVGETECGTVTLTDVITVIDQPVK